MREEPAVIFDQSPEDRKVRVFSLSPSFLDEFRDRQPNWGFNGLGYFTFKRTYARELPEGGTEEWWQTCRRVVEGVYNIQKVHCRRLNLPWSEPKAQRCLPEGTGVHLTTGIVPIEQVRVGDEVQTVLGIGKVTNVWDQGEQETVQINTPFGVLECTSNHEVAVFRDDLFSWEFVRAGDLEEGDRLVFDARGYEGTNTKLPASDKVLVPDLTPEIAWLIGEVHGDGYVQIPPSSTNGAVRLRIEKTRPQLTEALQRAGRALSSFGHVPRVYENETFEVKLFSNDIAGYFFSYIKQPNRALSVPEWIRGASQAVRSGYLAGLFDADGSCKNRPLVAVTTVYEGFAEQVRHLCASLGIASYVVKVPVGTRCPHPRFNVCVKGYENIEKFRQGIGQFSTKLELQEQARTSKRTHSFPIETVRSTFGGWDGENKDLATYRIAREKKVQFSALPVEVISIDPGRVVQTYDIEVEGLRQFTVAGGFVVHNSAQEMFRRMWGFKFLPPGRGLWMMGTDVVYQRGSAALMNCFEGGTEIITADGVKPIGELVGTTQTLLTTGGRWVEAPIRAFGEQRLYKLWLTRQGVDKVVFCTGDHRWFARDRRQLHRGKGFIEFKTTDLRPEVHHLQYVFGQGIQGNVKPSPFGVAHGFTYGDGCSVQGERNANAVYLVGEKDAVMQPYFSLCPQYDRPSFDGVECRALPNFFRELPPIRENKSYLLGWLMGYFAADGSVSPDGQVTIASAKLTDIEFVRDLCTVVGIGSYSIRQQERVSNLTGKPHTMHTLCLMRDTLTEEFFLIPEHKDKFFHNGGAEVIRRHWTVKHIEETDRVEEVYCATVEGYGAFALEGNILTGNCSFVSTEDLAVDFAAPFCFLMDMSMLGVGVGGDTRGKGKVRLGTPRVTDEIFVVEDSREGWVDLLKTILNSFVAQARSRDWKWKFPSTIDFSLVRKRGAPLKTFGGTSSGPGPLIDLIKNIIRLLAPKGVSVSYSPCDPDEPQGPVLKTTFSGSGPEYRITSSQIVDIFNYIGKAVVAGGIRRSSEIMFGDPDDRDFITLKQDKQALDDRRWVSNNSIFGVVGMDYSEIAASLAKNGEPGVVWMENARQYGRMGDPPNNVDHRVAGTNPCAEIALESFECCNLVETFPAHHDSFEDYQRTLKMAYLYSKTVTLVPCHNPRTNAVMMRNRRIGCSMSGIQQAKQKLGRHEFLVWCDEGYRYIQDLDKLYSEWLCIPRSVKTTTTKPSGCRPWYALTTTDRGILTLEDIFENHPAGQEWAEAPEGLRTWYGGKHASPEAITKTYSNGVSPVLRITTSYGIEVESTPNHKWWVSTTYNRTGKDRYPAVNEWRRADEIQPGDILDIHVGVYNVERPAPLEQLNSLALNMRGDAAEIQQPSYMNPRLAWFLGYLWGDGSMSPQKYRLRWIDARRENLEKAQAILKEQFGLDAEIHKASEHRKAETLEIGSKHLWHWLIRNDVFKLYAGKIDLIPKAVRTSSQEDILAFLAGLLDSDGCTSKAAFDSTLIWTTSDGDFVRHVQDVALAVGVVASRSHVTGGSSLQARRSMYHLTASGHTTKRALALLRKHSTKMVEHEQRSDFVGWRGEVDTHRKGAGLILGKVLRVESIGEMPTYDVEVAETHWYYAGAIRSHNTVSLLAGATPGIHHAHSRYYIRNIRVENTSPLVAACREAGYIVEPDTYADDTSVVSFPVATPNFSKGKSDITIWEQFTDAVAVQRHWADNQVSCLTGDALIRTSVGILPMVGLASEMGIEGAPGAHPYKGPLKVLNADNEWSSVSALVINPPKPLKLVILEGGQDLCGTPDHEVQVIGEDLQLTWRALSDLQPEDHVVEVINQSPYPSSHQILARRLEKYQFPGRRDADERVEVPTRMTPELAEFLGYMTSDGWVQRTTGRAFGLSQKANNVAERYEELVQKLFGLDVRVSEDPRCSGDLPLLALVTSSTKVAHWLQWIDLYDADGFKRVPWPLMMAGPQAIKAYLRGVTLDGHYSKSNGRIVVMTSNSTRLCDELCQLLKQVGFQPLKQAAAPAGEREFPHGQVYSTKETWAVSLSAGQSSRFMRMIGFAEDNKTDAYEEHGDKTRRHVFGSVPDYGLRAQMRELSRRCQSRLLKDHWHSRGQHEGTRVSRETLLQMQDMGVEVPDHLLRADLAFRRVLSVNDGKQQPTFDLTVEGSHSYVANGFASHNCTITFRPEEAGDIAACLEVFQDQLKGISLLPSKDHGYAQAPYIEIDRETFDKLTSVLKPLDLSTARHEVTERFCTSDKCELSFAPKP